MKRDCKHDNLMRWVDIGLQSAVESDVSYNDPVSLTRARQGGVNPFHMKWNEITQGFLSKQGTLGPKLGGLHSATQNLENSVSDYVSKQDGDNHENHRCIAECIVERNYLIDRELCV